jgi:hypothetical protein
MVERGSKLVRDLTTMTFKVSRRWVLFDVSPVNWDGTRAINLTDIPVLNDSVTVTS